MAKKQTLADQIAAFRDTRAEKSARMSEIMEEAEGSTLDASQQEEFDTLEAEIDEIDAHVKRLRTLQKAQAETARPVEDDPRGGADPRDARMQPIAAKAKAPRLDPGIAMARVVKCYGLAKLDQEHPREVAERIYGNSPEVVKHFTKAAVPAASTGNSTWAGALIGEEGTAYADFVEFLRHRTILGQFGANGNPSLRRVPFRVPLITQTGGMTGHWVGEGKAKPLTKADFARTTMDPLKVAAIAVATEETLRDSSPSAEMLIRDDLAAALIERMDTSFIDPSNSGSSGLRPASITNGITAIPSAGGDAESVRTDVKAAMGAFIAAKNPLTSGVWIMSATNALALSIMTNPLGQAEFPGLTMNGGTFFGLPAIISEHIGDVVVLANAGDIYLGDDGGIRVDMSREASLEMMDNPTGDSAASTPVAAEMVSLWQTNSVGFRAERTVNWMRRRASGVAVLSGVEWGTEDEGGEG